MPDGLMSAVLKIYIYDCIIWKVHTFLVKKDKCFCVIKMYIILY